MTRQRLLVTTVACLLTGGVARAHPMGDFAICHYSGLEAQPDVVRVRYVLDLAEIPTVAEKYLLDRDRDGTVTAAERDAYLATRAPELVAGLLLRVDDNRVSLRQKRASIRLEVGDKGLEILKIALDLEAAVPDAGGPYRVDYRDRNYEARTGWKEVVAVGGAGVALRNSSVPSRARSNELSDYPAAFLPPQDTEARFTAVPTRDAVPGGWGEEAAAPDLAPRVPRSGDALTQAVTSPELGLGIILAGLAIAFAFGALHALSPGHGKTMVAAYLVGTRGTAGHAVLLGLVVTVTHTLGVFALGVVTLVATQYVVPERLYPWLSALSGLAVLGVGVWLLYRRVRRWLRGPRPAGAAPAATGHHHGLPEGPVTVRSLLALGVSGGLVPCPSALVVLLSAVALQRVGYGMLLITAFSLGLASVLVAIGLLVVCAGRWLERLPAGRPVLRVLSLAGAVTITVIGLTLIARAFAQGGF